MILTPVQIAQACYNGGYRGIAIAYQTAIGLAESSGNTEAVSPVQSDGTRGYGLFQIETENVQGGNWQDPVWQAQKAYAMSGGGTNFEPWCTATAPMPIYVNGVRYEKGCEGYGSGASGQYLAEAYNASAQVQPVATTNGWPGTYLKVETPPIHWHGTLRWQQKMNALIGARLTEDGYYGPMTGDATKRFQADKGLTQDGIVGPRTWGAAFG